jgi:sulfite reductase (NADPH) flavoprotein alpha-component
MQSSGLLTRLDLAFSRDQSEKIYVQDRMLENAKELFAWLERGAYFFICGDAYHMAKDVDKALHTIIEQQGGLSAQASEEYVNQLKKQKRYVRDVY